MRTKYPYGGASLSIMAAGLAALGCNTESYFPSVLTPQEQPKKELTAGDISRLEKAKLKRERKSKR